MLSSRTYQSFGQIVKYDKLIQLRRFQLGKWEWIQRV